MKLEAREITYGYLPDKPILEHFSLTVDDRERVAVAAPSGAGKTTLCRLLAGYEQPWTGEILLDGKPLPRKGYCPVQMIWQHPEKGVNPRL